MQNLYSNTSVEKQERQAYEARLKYQQNKANRHKAREASKNKSGIYFVTAIVVILTLLMVASVVVASALLIKNEELTAVISVQEADYLEAVRHYEALNETAAQDAVDTFMQELTDHILSVDPNSLVKTKLREFIAETESYIDNYVALGLNETHPEVHESLIQKYDDAVYALENETYLYPYTDKDYVLMCNLVMREQGANVSDDEAQRLVAWVALMRKENGSIYAKDATGEVTLLDVLLQPGQYGPNYSYNMTLDGITDKVKENVRKVFEGEFEAPRNVLFQTGIYYPPEKKTLYKKFYNPAPYDNYTYFYYGKTEAVG